MLESCARRRLLLAILLLIPAVSAWADTVVRPLSIQGTYSLTPSPHSIEIPASARLGITFSQITSAGLRIDAGVVQGKARALGSTYVESFSPVVTTTLVGDDLRAAAFGDVLLPDWYDQVLAMDSNLPGDPVDYSALLDGVAEVRFGIDLPLMAAITAIESYPLVEIRASALVVTGETQGRLIGDFDGDGSVYLEDYEFFYRTFGQHVHPGTGADANGNGVVDVADYVSWRDNIGASIRPTNGFLAGDYDYNGTVDLADYGFWKQRFGRKVAPFSGADGNGNGVIDPADFRVWRDQYGHSLPDHAPSIASVPEPGAIALLILGVGCWPWSYRQTAGRS